MVTGCEPCRNLKQITIRVRVRVGVGVPKAVVGGPAGPAMAVPLFLPSLYYCNVVLFFVFKLNQKSNNFINQKHSLIVPSRSSRSTFEATETN